MKGFTTLTQTYKSCWLCDYHDRALICSGRQPLHHYYCCHPDWQNEHQEKRTIGDSDRTPSWCPYLKQC